MSWTEYAFRSSGILVIMIIGYILFTKLSRQKINWETVTFVLTGHALFIGLGELTEWIQAL